MQQDFAEHFMKEYATSTKANWYYGKVQGAYAVPITNNSLERKNRDLKESGTYRNKTSASEFLATVLPAWLGNESKDDKVFTVVPEIDRNVWRDAQKLLESGLPQAAYTFQGDILIPSCGLFASLNAGSVKEKRQQLHPIVTEFKNWCRKPQSVQRMAPFVAMLKKCYVLAELPEECKSEYILYSCTCEHYLHYMHCKHVLGMALSQGLIQVPPDQIMDVIGPEPRPGRPTKAKPGQALVRD